MEVNSVLVTGANRGIGLEFVRQLVQLPRPPRYVFGTYRSSDTLQALKDIQTSSKTSEVILIKMDVTKPEDIKSARKIVEEKVGADGLTLLINNAGVAKHESFPNITVEKLEMQFTTNTVGPLMVLQELVPLLEKAAARKAGAGLGVSRSAVINITAALASITNMSVDTIAFPPVPGYRISKAALNMAMREVAGHVKDKGILVILMCPGWVKTDMGSEHAELEARDSIADMIKTFTKLDESHHGTFMDRHGTLYPF